MRPEESLSFYIYREPKKAKQLSFGIIPKAVDEYWQFRGNYAGQPIEQKLGNPGPPHPRRQRPRRRGLPISFALLLNLASLPGVGDRETIWAFLHRYNPELSPETEPHLDRLVGHAVTYARDFVAPSLRRRPPTPEEAEALRELDELLATASPGEDDLAAVLQNHIYEIGKARYGKERLRDWFQVLYETLLGSSQGPRMGSFIALYGIDNSRKLIAEALASI